MLIYGVSREKEQRFEGSEACTVFLNAFYMLHRIPTQPVTTAVYRLGLVMSLGNFGFLLSRSSD
jgi:hypothetical protein